MDHAQHIATQGISKHNPSHYENLATKSDKDAHADKHRSEGPSAPFTYIHVTLRCNQVRA